jgi:hypothetical protein
MDRDRRYLGDPDPWIVDRRSIFFIFWIVDRGSTIHFFIFLDRGSWIDDPFFYFLDRGSWINDPFFYFLDRGSTIHFYFCGSDRFQMDRDHDPAQHWSR